MYIYHHAYKRKLNGGVFCLKFYQEFLRKSNMSENHVAEYDIPFAIRVIKVMPSDLSTFTDVTSCK